MDKTTLSDDRSRVVQTLFDALIVASERRETTLALVNVFEAQFRSESEGDSIDHHVRILYENVFLGLNRLMSHNEMAFEVGVRLCKKLQDGAPDRAFAKACVSEHVWNKVAAIVNNYRPLDGAAVK